MTAGNVIFNKNGTRTRLTRENELEIVKKVKNGDRRAYDALVKQFYPFIVNNSKKYLGYNIDIDDLIAYGLEGFHKGVLKFNLKSNVRLLTYVSWWVDALQQRAARSNTSVVRRDVGRCGNIPPDVYYDGIIGTNQEAIGEQAVDAIMYASDMVEPAVDPLVRREAIQLVDRVLNMIPKEHSDIARGRFCDKEDKRTLEELGEEQGVSRERIRQMELKIKRRLKGILSEYADNYDLQIEEKVA